MYVCGNTWAKGNQERERKPVARKEIESAKKLGTRKYEREKIGARKRERKSAKFMAKKERESASAKGSTGSAKAQARRPKESACPAQHLTF